MKTVGVIGAGPAGLIAGAFAARENCRVDIIDRNEKAGKKLFLTGKGRCNITNSADIDGFFKPIPHNGRFLFSEFTVFFNDDIIRIINSCGVSTKLERGGRYFPESDKSSDVIRALTVYVSKCGAKLLLNSRVKSVSCNKGTFTITFFDGTERNYDAVILATGGVSYSSTGSTGDGYKFAESFGHTIVSPKPSLIPFVTKERWASELMGLSLKNVVLRAYKSGEVEKDTLFSGKSSGKSKRKKPVYEELGEMLFTHFGVSGPLVLSASSFLADDPVGARLEIDLKPGLTADQLDARVLRDFEKYRHKQVRNAMQDLLPQRLIDTILILAEVDGNEVIDCLTREQRLSIVGAMKCMTLTVASARPIDEAIITRGGISVKEINPSTMESKLIPGLFFAGEMIDVDACTGGYNLQIAWSTGAVAGRAAAI